MDQPVALQAIERPGTSEEVATIVVWLCSDDVSFVTGVPIPIEAGYTVQWAVPRRSVLRVDSTTRP